MEGPAIPRSARRLADGTVLNDRYTIEALTARTAYGELYRARDAADARVIGVLALHPALVTDAEVRGRLEREIQVAVQLDHKNIGATYGLFGATVGNDAVAYLALEHIEGQTLREMIDKKRAAGRAFSLKGAYNVVAHLCNAMVYAHGVTVHGGLSADSVMVNSAGRVKVTDFGLARALRGLDHFRAHVDAGGGLASLPPEIATTPERADGRADLYSVGAILFELMTGRPPTETFERPSAVSPGLPAAVDEVVERCLRPIPEQRFADAQTLKEALHGALAADLAGPNASHEPAAAMPAASAQARAAPSRRGQPRVRRAEQAAAPPPKPAPPRAKAACAAAGRGCPTAAGARARARADPSRLQPRPRNRRSPSPRPRCRRSTTPPSTG